jgi:protein SCO1/2
VLASKSLFWACAILLAGLFAAKLFTTHIAERGPVAAPSYGVVPEFKLFNQSGGETSFKKDLEGRIWIANFIFTRCAGVCPIMSGKMRGIAEKFEGEPEIRFVSFSVDPQFDTPEVLGRYAGEFQADSAKWFFLTGPQKTLHRLSQKYFRLGVMETPEEEAAKTGQAMMHSSKFVLVDREGVIRGYYDSENTEFPEKLVADTQNLISKK